MRCLGYNFLFGAVISALIAKNPDRHPILLPLMAILAGLTIVAWLLAPAFGEMTAGQVGGDISTNYIRSQSKENVAIRPAIP